MVAIIVLVWEVAREPVLLGVVGVARIAPYAILSVPAGMLADRFDRRLILISTDLLRAVLMLVLGWLVASGGSVALVVALAIVASCVATFFGPAIGAYLPTVVGDEAELGPANSLWSTLDSVAFMIGPAVGGVLIAVGGLTAAFLLNAGSFVICAVILLGLPHGRPQRSGGEATGDGITANRGRVPKPTWRALATVIRGPILLDAATGIAGGALSVMTVILAVDVLGGGEAATGYLNGAIGLGGIVAGFIAGTLTLRPLGRPLAVATVLAALGLAAVAVTTSLAVALVILALASGALLILDVVNTTLVQRLASDTTRGRALGLLQMTGTIAFGAGSFFGPVLSGVVGVGNTLVAAGAALVAVGGVAVAVMVRSGALNPPPADVARRSLLSAPVFAGLPPNRLEAIAGQLRPREVAASEMIIRQGDEADRFYIVESGSYRVTAQTDGVSTKLRVLGSGDVFGEIALLAGGLRTATVTAETPGRVWALDADAFRELVQAGPGLGSRLLDLYRGAPPDVGSRAQPDIAAASSG